jgi:hypothetical protein
VLQLAKLALFWMHLSPHALQLLMSAKLVQVVPPQTVPVQTHVPPLHWGVGCAHVVWFTQLPVAPQLCVVFPEQLTCPGAQTPRQTPPEHVWLVHGDTPPHMPVAALQACAALPLHCVSLGAQMPWHAPMMHVWCVHAVGVPHMPPAAQFCTPFPEHCVCPGAQMP